MNSMPSYTGEENEESFDLMDIVLTLAENLRLLLVGPLLVGGLAFGLTFWWPAKFESTAILNGGPEVAISMTSAPVLHAAFRNMGYLKELSGEQLDRAHLKLAQRVSASASRDGKTITLKVTDTSPEAAQRLANEVLALTFIQVKPKGSELQRLTRELTTLSQQAAELSSASQTAQRLLERASSNDNLGQVADAIASISGNLLKTQEGIIGTERRIAGLTEDDLIQPPTLQRRSVAPDRPMVAVLATAATGFFLLIFVFARQAWTNATALERHQPRLQALKRRYGIGQ